MARRTGIITGETGPGTRADHATRWQPGAPSPNPNGRRGRGNPHADGWQNLATSVGVAGRDKRMAGAVRLDYVSNETAQALWRGNDIARKFVELIPRETVRRGFSLECGDAEVSKKLGGVLDLVPGPQHVGRGILRVHRAALEYQRAYGGAAIWPVTNDSAGSLSAPINWRSARVPVRLQLFEPRELQPLSYYRDPTHPKWGEVEKWSMRPMSVIGSGTSVAIHESRLVIYPGFRVSRQQPTGAPSGWGDNIFTTCLAAINDFESTYGGVAALMSDVAQAVIKLKNLSAVASSATNAANARLEFMNAARSLLNAILLDSEDSFERVSTPLSGVPEIMDRIANRLAMSVGIPVSKLLGQAPAGLNATGEADEAAYHATCEGEQSGNTPMFEGVVRFWFRGVDGPTAGKEPEAWRACWPPFKTPSEAIVATTRLTDAQRDAANIASGVYSADDVARSRYPDGGAHGDIVIDYKARAEAAEIAADFATTTFGDPDEGAEEGDEGAEEGDEGGEGDEGDAPSKKGAKESDLEEGEEGDAPSKKGAKAKAVEAESEDE